MTSIDVRTLSKSELDREARELERELGTPRDEAGRRAAAGLLNAGQYRALRRLDALDWLRGAAE